MRGADKEDKPLALNNRGQVACSRLLQLIVAVQQQFRCSSGGTEFMATHRSKFEPVSFIANDLSPAGPQCAIAHISSGRAAFYYFAFVGAFLNGSNT
jgi:hypothetical protein